RLTNLASHAAKVIWDEVVFVDFDGTSGRVMHSGVRYIDRNVSQVPTVVAPHGWIRDIVVPVIRVWHSESGGWQHLPLILHTVRGCTEPEEDFRANALASRGAKFGILLPVQIQGVVNEYTLTF